MAVVDRSSGGLDEIHSQRDESDNDNDALKPSSSTFTTTRLAHTLIYECPPSDSPPEPIVIKGRGNLTVFGINNRFEREFPSVLVGKVAPEEFNETLLRINAILQRQVSLNVKWLICGCLCCCCTLGCSLWPAVCLKKRTVALLGKAIEWENIRLYHKIGLNLKLDRLTNDIAASLTEYILIIEFVPKVRLLRPD